MALLVAIALPALGSSCAYHFQTSQGSSLRDAGVQRIYIEPLKNNTYKPGVEHVVYNELLQSIAGGRRVRVVSRPHEADAILRGTVKSAQYGASATTDSNSLFPTRSASVIRMIVATEYHATLELDFELSRVGVGASQPLWSSSFNRSRRFPASNQKGSFGTTSPLINESEFDRALKELAREMTFDVHESMLAMF